MLDVRSGSVLALPAREQAEGWQAAVAVLAQSMGVRLITHIAVQSLKKLAKNCSLS
jgi:hypothetical protein